MIHKKYIIHYIIYFTIFIILSILLTSLYIENFTVSSPKSPATLDDLDDIDAVIYINLENREDRKKLILEEIAKMGFPETKIHKVSGIHIPKNGHKGCIQSHIIALNLAKLNNWQNVLILEDDAEMKVSPDEFRTKITEMFDYINGSGRNSVYNVIMLATAHDKKVEVDDADTSDIVQIQQATTSSAYIININYIDKLLNLFKYLNGMMSKDKWTNQGSEKYALDQKWIDMQNIDKWLGWRNDLIHQRNIESSTMMNNGWTHK